MIPGMKKTANAPFGQSQPPMGSPPMGMNPMGGQINVGRMTGMGMNSNIAQAANAGMANPNPLTKVSPGKPGLATAGGIQQAAQQANANSAPQPQLPTQNPPGMMPKMGGFYLHDNSQRARATWLETLIPVFEAQVKAAEVATGGGSSPTASSSSLGSGGQTAATGMGNPGTGTPAGRPGSQNNQGQAGGGGGAGGGSGLLGGNQGPGGQMGAFGIVQPGWSSLRPATSALGGVTPTGPGAIKQAMMPAGGPTPGLTANQPMPQPGMAPPPPGMPAMPPPNGGAPVPGTMGQPSVDPMSGQPMPPTVNGQPAPPPGGDPAAQGMAPPGPPPGPMDPVTGQPVTSPMQDPPPPTLPGNPRMMPPRAPNQHDQAGGGLMDGLMGDKAMSDAPTNAHEATQDIQAEASAMGSKTASALRAAFQLGAPRIEGGLMKYVPTVAGKPVGRLHVNPAGASGGTPQVALSELNPEFTGMGLGHKMYGELLKTHGRLASDTAVSPSAKRVWTGMAGRPGYGPLVQSDKATPGPLGRGMMTSGTGEPVYRITAPFAAKGKRAGDDTSRLLAELALASHLAVKAANFGLLRAGRAAALGKSGADTKNAFEKGAGLAKLLGGVFKGAGKATPTTRGVSSNAPTAVFKPGQAATATVTPASGGEGHAAAMATIGKQFPMLHNWLKTGKRVGFSAAPIAAAGVGGKELAAGDKRAAQDDTSLKSPERSAVGESKGLRINMRSDHQLFGEEAWDNITKYQRSDAKKNSRPDLGKHAYDGLTDFARGFFERCDVLGVDHAQAVEKVGSDYGDEARDELRDGLEKLAWLPQMARGGANMAERYLPGAVNFGKGLFGMGRQTPLPAAAPAGSGFRGFSQHANTVTQNAQRARQMAASPAMRAGNAVNAGWQAARPHVAGQAGLTAGGGLLGGFAGGDTPFDTGSTWGNAAVGAAAFNPWMNRMMGQRGAASLVNPAVRGVQGGLLGSSGGFGLDTLAGWGGMRDAQGNPTTNFRQLGGTLGTLAGGVSGTGRAMRNMGTAGGGVQRAGQKMMAFGEGALTPIRAPFQAIGRMTGHLPQAATRGGQFAQAGNYGRLAGLGTAGVLGLNQGIEGMKGVGRDFIGQSMPAIQENMAGFADEYIGSRMPQIQDQVNQQLEQLGLLGEDGRFNPMAAVGQRASQGVDGIFRSLGMDPSRMSPLQKMMVLGGSAAAGGGAALGSPIMAGVGGVGALAGLLPQFMPGQGQQRLGGQGGAYQPGQPQQPGQPMGGVNQPAPNAPQARNEWQLQQQYGGQQ